jgi:NAD(P)-dependent dehydrogenase (short-subunit alcohol dehydrogenase family)
VVLADTATEPLQTTAEEFTARGARVLSVITDVSDAVAVDALASRTLEHFGRVDIVVNNAAITNDGGRPLWQTDPQTGSAPWGSTCSVWCTESRRSCPIW